MQTHFLPLSLILYRGQDSILLTFLSQMKAVDIQGLRAEMPVCVCVWSTLQNRNSGLGGGFLQIIRRISFLCKIPGSALWVLFSFSNLEPLRKNEVDILESYLFFSNVHNILFHELPLPKSYWVGEWCKESAKQSDFYSISMVTCKKKKTLSMGYRK